MKTKLEELKDAIETLYRERAAMTVSPNALTIVNELIAEQAEDDDKIPHPSTGYAITTKGDIARHIDFHVKTVELARIRGSIMATTTEAEAMLILQNELFEMSRIKQRFCPDFVVDFDNRSQPKRRYEFDAVKKRWLGDTRYWTSMPATVWFAEESDTDVHAYLTRHYPEGF